MTRSRDVANIDTILTTKGDIYAASAAYTPTRLGVGNNGETLVADSSTSTGLRYNPIAANLANPVINGGMDIWQRGTSVAISNTNAYTADRWQGRVTTTCTTSFSRQTVSDSTNLPNIQYAMRVQRASGQTATPQMLFEQSIETVNSIPFAAKTITLSFYARKGANFSASNSAISVQLVTGTGTDQNVGLVVYTGYVLAISNSATLTTSWQRFTYTATLNSDIKEIGLQFFYNTTGTAGADDWFEITGVQIDQGTYTASSAPTFRRSGGTLAGELAACQRYYYVVASGLDKFVSWSAYYSSTGVAGSVPFKVSMRTTPTLVATTITDGYKISANSDFFTTLNLSSVSNSESGYIFADTNVSGTTGYASFIQTANSGTSVAFNAEL